MTRDSRAWRWIGFLIALVGVGFPYWQLAPEQAGLPRALYGPGLVAVGVIAMLLRAFGMGRFLTLWLLIAAATASSKKFDAPISADGQATACFSPTFLFSQ